MQLSVGVYNKNLGQWDANVAVTYGIRVSVTEASVERWVICREKIDYVLETGDLEDLRLL